MSPIRNVGRSAHIATCAGELPSSPRPPPSPVPQGFHLVGNVFVEDEINIAVSTPPGSSLADSAPTAQTVTDAAAVIVATCTECIICSIPVREVWVTPCGHGPMHMSCAEKWYRTFNKNRTTRCPSCRQILHCPPIKLYFLRELCEHNIKTGGDAVADLDAHCDLTWMKRIKWGPHVPELPRVRPFRMSTGGRPPRPQVFPPPLAG